MISNSIRHSEAFQFHVDNMRVSVPRPICIQACLFEEIDSPFETRNDRRIRHSSGCSVRSQLIHPGLKWLLEEGRVRRYSPSTIHHHWFRRCLE